MLIGLYAKKEKHWYKSVISTILFFIMYSIQFNLVDKYTIIYYHIQNICIKWWLNSDNTISTWLISIWTYYRQLKLYGYLSIVFVDNVF